MKKSLSLVELIFAIAIISIVIIGSLSFISHSYKAYNHSKDSVVLEVEIKSTLEFIQNKLTHSVDLISNPHKLEWNEIDYKGTRANEWSGYVDINKSDDETLVSPASNFDNDTSSKIIKIDKKSYNIKSSNANKIYFEDKSPKNITQTYLLISNHYTLKQIGSELRLYKRDFNKITDENYLLLRNVSKLDISLTNSILYITICIFEDKICSSKSITITDE